jgi:hypothetical protein
LYISLLYFASSESIFVFVVETGSVTAAATSTTVEHQCTAAATSTACSFKSAVSDFKP